MEKKRKSQKKWLLLLLAVVFLLAVIRIGETYQRMELAMNEKERQKETYSQAISAITRMEYGRAVNLLETLAGYQDGEALYAYALALLKYDQESYLGVIQAKQMIDQIPEGYQGEFAEKIEAFRQEIHENYLKLESEKETTAL